MELWRYGRRFSSLGWQIEPDGSRTLKQSGVAPFPWCVKPAPKFANGFVTTRFKPLGGKQDQAGGVLWRWKDGDNYYVARANALENNVSLYYTQGEARKAIVYVDAPVARNEWHTIRVEFSGTRIVVLLDGKRYIETNDSRIQAAGLAGVWTKADSETLFTDFESAEVKKRP